LFLEGRREREYKHFEIKGGLERLEKSGKFIGPALESVFTFEARI
jgi:hypothetical protein